MIIFVDLESKSWTDSTNSGLDLLPKAVAVRKETCTFTDEGLVKSVGPVLDRSPFEYKEGNENMINEETQEVGDCGDLDEMPEVLKTPKCQGCDLEKRGGPIQHFHTCAGDNEVNKPKKRGRPAGAKTIPWPEPWASRAKKAGGKTLLAKHLGITYDLLNKIVKNDNPEYKRTDHYYAAVREIDALPVPE